VNGLQHGGEAQYLAPSPRYGFDGRIALIADATRGVGRRLALALAARGATPIITYGSDGDGAHMTVAAIEELGISTISIPADPADSDDIESMFHTVEEYFGRLDFFISNPGASTFPPLMELEPDDLERSFNVNVRPFVLGAQCAAALMNRGGRIVVLSGCRSRYGVPAAGADAAVEEWSRHIAVELAPLGINVNVLMLGVIDSDSTPASDLVTPFFASGTRIPKRRPGSIEEVVDCALFLLSPASEYVTGTTLVVDGGLTACLPAVKPDSAPG
jgi:NAD(P)-dependent dehydrogenase (short-subunit alcohol dehydrogenase family)